MKIQFNQNKTKTKTKYKPNGIMRMFKIRNRLDSSPEYFGLFKSHVMHRLKTKQIF